LHKLGMSTTLAYFQRRWPTHAQEVKYVAFQIHSLPIECKSFSNLAYPRMYGSESSNCLLHSCPFSERKCKPGARMIIMESRRRSY
jgi:hypothetical protein